MCAVVGGLECIAVILLIVGMVAIGQASGVASAGCADVDSLSASVGGQQTGCGAVVGAVTGIAQAFMVIALIICLVNAIICFIFGWKNCKAKNASANLAVGGPTFSNAAVGQPVS